MGERILAHREALGPKSSVMGLLDGDFHEQWPPVSLDDPLPWTTSDGRGLGWRWRRKEIENYLIDPLVVGRALPGRFPLPEYSRVLESAVESIAIYQAARTALSHRRVQFRALPSSWVEKGLPDDLTEAGCLSGIQEAVRSHTRTQTVTIESITARYRDLLPEFAEGGQRRASYLWTFAGKDLLAAMSSGLAAAGFGGPRLFLERILVGIDNTAEEISQWVPEWSALLREVSP